MYQENFLPVNRLFPFEDVPRDKNIVLWGAGSVGKQYFSQLNRIKWAKSILWVDKNWEKYLSIYGEKCIIHSPDSIKDYDCDYVVIAVASYLSAAEIRNEINEKGISDDKIVWYPSQPPILLTDDKYVNRLKVPAMQELELVGKLQVGKGKINDWYDKISNQDNFVIPRLVVVLTTRCSLRCNGCNNLMPLVKKHIDFPYEKVLAWIQKILDMSDGIVSLELLGGEPFLYKDLNKVLEVLLKENKIFRVEITTNGTVIPKDETFSLLSSPKCFVSVSKYPGINSNEKFIEKLKEYNIVHLVMDDMVWIDPGEPVSHEKTASKLNRDYEKCGASYTCKTLLGGKIYPCARGASLFHLGYIKENEDEYVEIEENCNFRQKLKEFFLKENSIVCDYCTITDRWRRIKAGDQCKAI